MTVAATELAHQRHPVRLRCGDVARPGAQIIHQLIQRHLLERSAHGRNRERIAGHGISGTGRRGNTAIEHTFYPTDPL